MNENKKTINVLQFITPVGFYGAERWVLALINNTDSEIVKHDLVVTKEPVEQDLEILDYFPDKAGNKHVIEMTSRFDLSALTQLTNIIKERKIDIIHTHGYKSDILGLIASKKTGIKCISTPHGFGEPENFKLRLYIWLGAFSLRFFDSVVPLSMQLFQEVSDFSVPKKKITYIKNGVDLTEVEAHRKTKTIKPPGKKKKIGFIGQMIPRKNIKDLLDIFEETHEKLGDIELLLLGDGESRKELEKYSATLKSSSDIHFLGFRNDRMEYLKQFDLFAMTSKDEGIPRCLMEAMAMELPVVAYDIPGVNDLIEHKVTGLMAHFGDKGSLVNHWITVLSDKKEANRLANNALQFVRENFSAQRMANEYADLYAHVLNKKT